jgi:hypothetical protein
MTVDVENDPGVEKSDELLDGFERRTAGEPVVVLNPNVSPGSILPASTSSIIRPRSPSRFAPL